MKRYAILLILLALSLFGCTTQYSANYNLSTNGTSGSQNASAGTSDGQPSGTPASNAPPTAGTNASEGATVNESEASSAGADLSGKTYSDLLDLGSPSQCSVSYTTDSGTVNLNVFFDGNGAMRVEEPETGAQDCPSNVLIFKGDIANGGVLYTSCPGNNTVLGTDFMNNDVPCDWLSMNVSSQYGDVGSAGFGFESMYQTPNLANVPASDYNCQPWAIDGSKFDTPGYVCAQ